MNFSLADLTKELGLSFNKVLSLQLSQPWNGLTFLLSFQTFKWLDDNFMENVIFTSVYVVT